VASILNIHDGQPVDLRERQTPEEMARSISEMAIEQIGNRDDLTWAIGQIHQLRDENRVFQKALGDALMRLDDAALVVGNLKARVEALEAGADG
jgi:hypothetical protein